MVSNFFIDSFSSDLVTLVIVKKVSNALQPFAARIKSIKMYFSILYDVSNNNATAGKTILKISRISLLATGISILGFGIIVTAYPLAAAHTGEGLLRAIGVATTGMGIFGVMIILKAP